MMCSRCSGSGTTTETGGAAESVKRFDGRKSAVTIIDQNLDNGEPQFLLSINHKPLVDRGKPPNVNAGNIIFSDNSTERSISQTHMKIMNRCQIREDTKVLRRARRPKPIHRNLLFVLTINLSIAIANGSPSPLALFAPTPPRLPAHRPVPREARLGYRNSPRESSITELSATSATNQRDRRAGSASKIKSPSNRYTQFYKEGVLVGIENTSLNSRRISGEIVVDGIPIDDVWSILTDYDNLSSHVPNLVESRVVNRGGKGGRPRVYQQGAQNIWGFEFGADLTMEMTEGQRHDRPKMYSIDFKCVDSQFFSVFNGSWILEEYSNNRTMVRYIVDVVPKGPVPVAALEWRIKEDVPLNILAVTNSARAAGARRKEEDRDKIHEDGGRSERVAPSSSDRAPSPPRRPAARNLRVARALLPPPVYARAKRFVEAANGKTSGRRVPSMPGAVRRKKGVDDIIPDWYKDETMAMYLKDP